jgi:hypothetical protein
MSMITLVDRGPIFVYGCSVERCRNTESVYVRGDPIPICSGGYAFSFSTTTKFDGEEG